MRTVKGSDMAERHITCRGCGNQFKHDVISRQPEYCSKTCKRTVANARSRANRKPPDALTRSMRICCEACGVSGLRTTKGFCKACTKLSQRLIARTATPPFLADKREPKGPSCTCAVCGVLYKPKRKGRDTTCSRECGFEWIAVKARAKANGDRILVRVKRIPYVPPQPDAQCSMCGVGYVRSKAYQRRCSDECEAAYDAAVKVARQEARKRSPSRRKNKALRRALERGARTTQAVDPFVVFDRDGWRCQCCGVRTPKTKRGTYDSRAPELDHIIPVSKGGAHSYRNTQCLCRGCNGAKSDGVGGQMRLFGWAGRGPW